MAVLPPAPCPGQGESDGHTPDRWKAARLVEEVGVVLQEVSEQGVLGVGVGRGELELRRWCGAPNALLADAAALTPEDHRQRGKVPQYGP